MDQSFSLSFSSADVTINGIRIDVEGAGNPGIDNIPFMKVYNGSSWSSGKAFTNGGGGQFTKGGGTFSPGWGADDDLWGLSWNATTAAAIQIQIDSSTFDSGGYFWDWLKVKITYTEGYGNDVMGVDSSNISTISDLPPTILNGGTGFTIATNDWLDALDWIKNNTPKDAVIASWWDYCYLITTMGERTTLVDNATLNTRIIANICFFSVYKVPKLTPLKGIIFFIYQ